MKSDAVQIAHHCFNYLPLLYSMINADCALLPNSWYAGHTYDNDLKRIVVEDSLANSDSIWCEDKTTVFRFEDGRFKAVRELPLVGGPHDGVDLLGRKKEENASC